MELGIAPPSGNPSGETRRQTTLIRALCDRKQGRAARALGADRDKAPGSRLPRAGAALSDPLLGARPERVVLPVDSGLGARPGRVHARS